MSDSGSPDAETVPGTQRRCHPTFYSHSLPAGVGEPMQTLTAGTTGCMQLIDCAAGARRLYGDSAKPMSCVASAKEHHV
jgi:hypothetical protein